MAGVHNGYILEFPQIRVDCFTALPGPDKPQWRLPVPLKPTETIPAPPAQLFLLTHVHSDHLLGLSNDFTGQIICSPDTKEMLLRLQTESEKGLAEGGLRSMGKRKYPGLKARKVVTGTKAAYTVDRIETIPYGVPRTYDLGLGPGHEVTITLIDANHCPGSTMFLITSCDKAVLHTGDIRADSTYLQSLRRNPSLSEFFAPWTQNPFPPNESGRLRRRTLDRIYLDTSTVLGTGDMPDKEPVLKDLMDQMSLYPKDTVFFLNVWCFGWEDVVKEVARHFDTPVYVDQYKNSIHRSVKSDPFLSRCTTLDPRATRFHACERKHRCEECRVTDFTGQRIWNRDKLVVMVMMQEEKSAAWEVERREFLNKLGRAAKGEGAWPEQINCPIARHSPLPELQALVKLFRPKSISPNTMALQQQGRDYYLLPNLFADCLSTEGPIDLKTEMLSWFKASPAFGPSWVRKMEKVLQDESLPSSLDNSQNQPCSVKEESDPRNQSFGPSTMKDNAIGRDRGAHIREHVARAGGMITHQASASDIALRPDSSSSLRPDLLTKAMLFAPEASKHFGGWYEARPRDRSDEDYDTDEEEPRRKRSYRPIKVELSRTQGSRRSPVDTKAGIGLHSVATPRAISVKSEPNVESKPIISTTMAANRHVDQKPMFRDEGIGRSSTPATKFEPASPPRTTSRQSSSQPNSLFPVNKEHLRAILMVSAKVENK